MEGTSDQSIQKHARMRARMREVRNLLSNLSKLYKPLDGFVFSKRPCCPLLSKGPPLLSFLSKTSAKPADLAPRQAANTPSKHPPPHHSKGAKDQHRRAMPCLSSEGSG
jgi:hypothetical protein